MENNGQVEQPEVNKIAKLIITCNVETGVMEIGGHLSNLDLCLKMTVEAGHMILNLYHERAKAVPAQEANKLKN